MHQAVQGAEFHIDHVIPTAAGGTDGIDNLSLACPSCNLSKNDRTTASDPDTGRAVPLFQPRTQVWADHFAWVGFRVAGRTPEGRATVDAFRLNSPRRLFVRTVERSAGLFAADDAL